MYKQTRKKHDVLIPTSEVAGICLCWRNYRISRTKINRATVASGSWFYTTSTSILLHAYTAFGYITRLPGTWSVGGVGRSAEGSFMFHTLFVVCALRDSILNMCLYEIVLFERHIETHLFSSSLALCNLQGILNIRESRLHSWNFSEIPLLFITFYSDSNFTLDFSLEHYGKVCLVAFPPRNRFIPQK
jgi:hypothetical protein